MIKFKPFNSTLNNQRGSLLVTVIIASGVGLIALMGLNELLVSSLKATRTVNRETDLNLSTAAIREALRDNNVCASTLGGLNPNPVSPGQAIASINRSGSVLYETGDVVVGNYNEISEIRLLSPADSQPAGPLIGANSIGDLDVLIIYEGRGDLYGGSHVSRRVKVRVETNAAGNISFCASTPYQSFDNCRYLSSGPFSRRTSLPSPNCPAGYFVTGGGMSDGDISSNSFTNTVSGNHWQCHADDGDGSISCYVICCR